ncbi:MAG: methionine adenosyltransferase [Chloroflexota bacterium]|nr:MAG: methionine adenosyltransferase [Chloroflexota bacterium]
MLHYRLFTSESVCAGHPDKVADQVSDAILDAVYEQDPRGRVAMETLVTRNQTVLAGEVTTTATVDFESVARRVIRRLGYTEDEYEFTDRSPIFTRISKQSPDIAQGVDDGGAGDQGMMFGYATNETPELMPLPITLAHAICQAIDAARETRSIPYLRPDGKSQVTVRYENGKPVAVDKVVMAVPHEAHVTNEQIKADLIARVAEPILRKYGYAIDAQNVIVNGTGRWIVGGPASDTGLTGRKIVVDGYGGMARVGGGAFSGKDATKVDRSGAYGARFVAKNVVGAGLADRCEVQLAYAIGVARPVGTAIETFGTARADQARIEKFAEEVLDTSVRGIIEGLRLRRPVYEKTAAYGHFGRAEFSWEQVVQAAVRA